MALDPVREDGRRLGVRIAEARRAAGLTQRQLADLLDVTDRTVSAWERDVFNPYRHMRALDEILALGPTGTTKIDKMQVRLDELEKRLAAAETLLLNSDRLSSREHPSDMPIKRRTKRTPKPEVQR